MNEKLHRHALDMLTLGKKAACVSKYYKHLSFGDVDDYQRRYRQFVRHSNTAGLGIGEREVAGSLSSDLVLRFYVRRKLPKSRVQRKFIVPETLEVPGLGKMQTDVVEIGDIQPHSGRRLKSRPASPGCSVGLGLVAGTLGCFVKKKSGAARYVLTNAHVIARDGIAPEKTKIFQPAPIDEVGSAHTVFASLSDVVRFEYSPTKDNNLVDAAIARLSNPHNVDTSIIGIGSPQGLVQAKRGMKVMKSGRSTGLTHGVILDTDFRTRMQYQRDKFGNLGWVGFSDQVLVSKFSQGGDSGSLVLNDKKMAVGLLFAGSDQVSICNKIQNVFQLLDVELA